MVRKVSYITLIGVLVSGLAVYSGCRHHRHDRGAAFLVDYLSEVLDLTEPQQEQLDRYKEEIMEKALRMRADRKALHEDMINQLRTDDIDKEQLKKTVAKARSQMNEMVDLVVDRLVEFHHTLTPEQKDKLVSKLEKFEQWHRPDL